MSLLGVRQRKDGLKVSVHSGERDEKVTQSNNKVKLDSVSCGEE